MCGALPCDCGLLALVQFTSTSLLLAFCDGEKTPKTKNSPQCNELGIITNSFSVPKLTWKRLKQYCIFFKVETYQEFDVIKISTIKLKIV